jgi:uracil-DNA glycosylase
MDTFLFTKAPEGWHDFFQAESQKPFWKELSAFVEAEYRHQIVHPKKEEIFAAFHAVRPEKIKCILLGQDPYHGPNQAMGLSFSVREGVKVPPSLRNIFKEYSSDLDVDLPSSGDLRPWASQGVFLLNSVLTVRATEAGSHAKKGWEEFVLNAVRFVLERNGNAGFLCFGKPAHRIALKAVEISDHSDPVIVSTVHPSPLSAYRGFFGSRPFTTFNAQQQNKGREIVPWELPESGQKRMF